MDVTDLHSDRAQESAPTGKAGAELDRGCAGLLLCAHDKNPHS